MLRFQNELGIKYLKLHFSLIIQNDGVLPQNKASAIRGGIGEMLLQINCVSDRNCEACEYEPECIVRRSIYSKFDIKPDYITTGDSVGYVIYCGNLETDFYAGDILDFELTLFGKTVAYVGQYLQSIFALGQSGLGKESLHYQVYKIKNIYGADVLTSSGIDKSKLGIALLSDYVSYRLDKLGAGDTVNLKFVSPTTIKHGGEFIKSFSPASVLESIKRRVIIMDYFCNIDVARLEEFKMPDVTELEESSKLITVARYSTRKQQKILLKGLTGQIVLDNCPREVLELVLACEILHIGKNTSFGFGKLISRNVGLGEVHWQ